MRRIFSMYKLVMWVDTKIKEADKAHPEVVLEGKKHNLTGRYIMEEYAKYSGKTFEDVRDLLDSCIDPTNNFLELELIKDDPNIRVHPGAGREFIDGPVWTGLIVEFVKRYYLLLIIIFGSATVVSGLRSIWHIIK